MDDFIPFVQSQAQGTLVSKYYADAAIVRVPLLDGTKTTGVLPKRAKLWVDPMVDGFDDLAARVSTAKWTNPWYELMKALPGFSTITAEASLAKPSQPDVDVFVRDLLDKCLDLRPHWLTVPQLPVKGDASRNKINRALAKAAGRWKGNRNFSGRLILPLVFTNQSQVNKKTSRNPKVQLAEQCFHDAGCDGFWVVDSDLCDETGSATLRNKRFPGILALHEEINARIPSRIRICGPYWGLNLVLWAKGLCDFGAIGVGSFQYFLSGGMLKESKARICISSLRRRAAVNTNLVKWLADSTAEIGTSHPAYADLAGLQRRMHVLFDKVAARDQVAEAYSRWLSTLGHGPAAGRSMALFQDLSAAYMLGKLLPPLADEKTARRPEAVAEPLMMSCL